MDAVNRAIVGELLRDGRATYQEVGSVVGLSAPAVKRRVDRLRAAGALRGFTTVVDPAALGDPTEALVELFYAPGTLLDEIAERFASHPEIVEAWSVTGDADAIVRVHTTDNKDLERLIMELQRDGSVVRTRSQVVLSYLVTPRG